MLLNGYTNARDVLLFVFYSEVFNFFFWFVKFAPLFFLWYPIHRAQWFQGGESVDYFRRRHALYTYRDSPKYKDPNYSRCVVPDTTDAGSCVVMPRSARRGGLASERRERSISAVSWPILLKLDETTSTRVEESVHSAQYQLQSPP